MIRVLKGADERRQLADRIAAAKARRAAGTSGATTKTELPGGPNSMEAPEDVLSQLMSSLGEVKEHVNECVKQTNLQIDQFQAELSLTGDGDIGTLIEASALTTADGQPLPARFDDCVRGVMQTLALPPMRLEDEFRVKYEFDFR